MKINIERISKHQAGGYLTYRPLTKPPEAVGGLDEDDSSAPRGRAAAKDKDDVDDKSLDKLLGNGITTDVMQFSNELKAAENEYASLTDSEKEGAKGRHLRGMLKGNFAQLNALIRSKDTFDKAVTTATANGAMEEFAVTNGAFVVKKLDGTLSKVGFQQFTKDRNSGELSYKPLTNAELAREREYNKSLTGDSSVFSILQYGKGIEQVKKEALEIAAGIGSSSASESSGAYDEGTIEAMKEAKLAAGQGMFKVKESSSQSSNKAQIERAKQVMWATLSNNSKDVLRARAAMTEKDPSKVEQSAALLAMDLLDPRLDQASTHTSDMVATRPGKAAGGKGGSGGADPLADTGAREAAAIGKTQEDHLEMLSDYGVNIQSRMYALPIEDTTRTDKDGVIKKVPLNSSGLAKYAYMDKASTLDGQKVDPNNTIFTGDAYYSRLPVRRGPGGTLILDEEGAKRLAAAEEEIAKLPESQRTRTMEEAVKMKHGAGNLNVQEVIVAEAASYDNKYTMFGLRGKKDSKFFKDADGETERQLGEAVDPDSKGARSWVDYKAYKHLVIIPSKGETAARFADKNNIYTPKRGYDTTGMGPQSSSRSYGGSSSQPVNPAFTIDALKQ